MSDNQEYIVRSEHIRWHRDGHRIVADRGDLVRFGETDDIDVELAIRQGTIKVAAVAASSRVRTPAPSAATEDGA